MSRFIPMRRMAHPHAGLYKGPREDLGPVAFRIRWRCYFESMANFHGRMRARDRFLAQEEWV